MPSTFPLNITELTTELKELVGDYIGEFSNGLPAIHVRPPELIDREVNGILCLVERYPRLNRSRNCRGSRQAIQNNDWIVLFRQYNRNVIPVTLPVPISAGAETIPVSTLQAGIHQGATIDFSGQTITTSDRAFAGDTTIAIHPATEAIAASTGLHDPMKDLDAVVAAMRSRYPNMRERILETTEEGVYPQVSYLLNFNNILNLV